MAEEKGVVDEVSGWLRVYDDGSVDRTWVGPPEAKFMVDPVQPHENFVDGVAVRDVDPLSGPSVRIYMPEPRSEDESGDYKLPIVLHFHGGGFCISQPDWFLYYTVYSKLARLGRVIVVSVYLRLAPENRLPAAIDDGYGALLWLTSLARTQTYDPWLSNKADFKRVFLIGDSSGANLVHEVAFQGDKTDLNPLKLVGLIPIHPGIARSTRSKSELEMPQTAFLTLDMVDQFLGLALPIRGTKDDPIICPMDRDAPPVSRVRLPPIMYCVADKDLFIDTQMEWYEALKKEGESAELYESHNMSHSFYLNYLGVKLDDNAKIQFEKLFDKIIDFIKRH
ncbi:hypothetical protein RND81_02G152800 [Saponaria officinalis]|uniref:Alpha/beta hydrolase fold-3 domain-containing protein n=1 Tax=Saponaria officinalis TaxID=3572 RepID=A0AAW1MUI0_SAPOF